MASNASDERLKGPTRAAQTWLASTILQQSAKAFWSILGDVLQRVAESAHILHRQAQAWEVFGLFGYA
jgi:hypothetical protein